MKTITISIHTHPVKTVILNGTSLLTKMDKILKDHKIHPDHIGVITDSGVPSMYLSHITASLSSVAPLLSIVIEQGESSKTVASSEKVISRIAREQFTKKSLLIALGGGMICDLTGFTAAIYMRGIQTVYIPTTLLSQVDAAIGGKTALNVQINSQQVKNLLGVFHQPSLIVCDSETLQTLAENEIRNGLGELIKYAIGWNHPTLKEIQSIHNNPNDAALMNRIIETAQTIKAQAVNKDPYELTGHREQLNLGHTIGHALEGYFAPNHSHGECVALGLIAELAMSAHDGFLSINKAKRLISFIRGLGYIQTIKLTIDELKPFLSLDKKRGTYVAVEKIGKLHAGVLVTEQSLMKGLSALS